LRTRTLGVAGVGRIAWGGEELSETGSGQVRAGDVNDGEGFRGVAHNLDVRAVLVELPVAYGVDPRPGEEAIARAVA